MRIGLVIYGSLDTLTGGYLYDRIVTEELKQRGHEIEAISLPPDSYLRNLLRGLFTSPAILLQMRSCDVILQDELCHPSLLRYNRINRPPQSPPRIAVVHHLLSTEPRDFRPKLLLSEVEKRYLLNVDGFIFNSQSTRKAVEAMVGEQRPHVVAYPAGDRFGFPLSPEYIAARCLQAGPLRLLFLGNLIPRKGLLPLVEKLAMIDRRSWRLSVVGGVDFDPGYAEKTQQRAVDLGLSEQIQFLGMLSEDQLIGQLGQSDLLCMPFSYEGFGIAIAEAMAFGLPALCSVEGAAAETVEHGTNGFLFSAADNDELGSIITELYRHRDQLKKLSLAAFGTATSKPGWSQSAAVIEEFLQAWVSSRGSKKNNGTTNLETVNRSMGLDRNYINQGLAQTRGNTNAQDFSPEYLAAKKIIDDQALNKEVWHKLAQELARYPETSTLEILEIGAGIGTMIERIIDWGLLKGQVIYTATDSDPIQLAAARVYLTSWAERKKHNIDWDGDQQALLYTPETTVKLTIRQARIEDLAAGSEPPHTWDLLIAHAVLDLIDFTAILPNLLKLLKNRGLFYTTCNFDGATSFSPPCKDDETIINHYHESMEQRCFGASMTGRRLLSFLEEQGLDLLASGSSDWLIAPQEQVYSPEEHYFLGVIIAMVEKELTTSPHHASKASDWIRQRRLQASAGTLSFTAHHLDMLARYFRPAER